MINLDLLDNNKKEPLTVGELKAKIDYLLELHPNCKDDILCVPIKGHSQGVSPATYIVSVSRGFDHDACRLFLFTKDNLKKAD